MFLWSAGAAALLSIPLVVLVPGSVPLVYLALLGLPANGPISPILPTAFEPLIMEVAKHQTVLAVATTALGVVLYVEFLNWHLYAWVLNWDRFAPLRRRRWVQRSVEWFSRSPFLTVVVFAFTPLPFWVGRCLAILNRYPLARFLAAAAIGRWPRYVIYAWAGDVLQVPSLVLLAIALGTAVILVGWRLSRGQRVLADAILDAPPEGARAGAEPRETA